jgi:hypothetical protein
MPHPHPDLPPREADGRNRLAAVTPLVVCDPPRSDDEKGLLLLARRQDTLPAR